MRTFERLGMVQDGVLPVVLEDRKSKDVKEQRVPSEPRRQSCDRGRGAADHACDLAMSGSVDESRGDGDEELRTLEVIGKSERLFGKSALAGGAAVARDAAAIRACERPESLVGEATG